MTNDFLTHLRNETFVNVSLLYKLIPSVGDGALNHDVAFFFFFFLTYGKSRKRALELISKDKPMKGNRACCASVGAPSPRGTRAVALE